MAHHHTTRILRAIENGATTPQTIAAEVGLPNRSVRETLFRLRRAGRATRRPDGQWQTLPYPSPQQVSDVVLLIQSDRRSWTASEISAETRLTLGQAIAIADTLARAGVIERVNTRIFRAISNTAHPQRNDGRSTTAR